MNYILKLKKEQLQIELKKADYLLNDIVINKGKTGSDSPLVYEDGLVNLWTTDFNKDFLLHLEELERSGELDVLWSIVYDPSLPREMVEQNLSSLVARLDEPFGINWSYQNKEEVHKLVEGMYVASLITAQRMAELMNPESFSFTLVDQRAINQLDNMGLIFASTATGPQIITPVATRLARQALSQGLGTRQAGELFKEGLRNIIPLRSDIYYNQLASVVIGRARNFSRILAFDRMGVTYGEIMGIPDNRICDRCMATNGTVVRISDLAAAVDRGINASTPEELIDVNPFINSIDTETNEFVLSNGARLSTDASSEQLAGAGLMPPFHGSCRCTVIIYTV